MFGINFAPLDGALRILCLGAHSDDIEIGCGGTVLRLLAEHPRAEVRWVVFSSLGERADEARNSAKRFLRNAGKSQIDLKDFRDGFMPYSGIELKQSFELLKREFNPDLIFTHYGRDLHQDHRMVSELTWNTFRNHMILEYEIVKYDGDIGNPNFFVQLSKAICSEKVGNLVEYFPSQRSKSWFSEDTFLAMLRIRGLECNATERYAEAFHCRKSRY
jgi:LmbE family N-acetylglucosaminyl deacetylase